ncbi:hypothetical protein GQ55_1G313100 [Panicum hallii var. hallii]|uniref:Uncharacterized protein n=1 Tax=Panicum hallii var. hallii TaxID=1504633 RepID=A0A2T7F9G9_9POAL|nr:hypothetical protein GQ55_1G313100 [Panicum hallii var. hallii]
MKLPLIPLLAVILSCSIVDATPLVYDTEGHELMSNSSYYILLVEEARGKAEDGVAMRIAPPSASVYDPIFNPVTVHLSTDITITFDVVTHVAVGKDEDADMPFPPSLDMLFSIERYDGAVKGYKLVSCNGTGPCENLGLHAF